MNRQSILGYCFLSALLIFAFVRAFRDDRWSGWRDDYKHYNGAVHFAKEGFIKHYFLPIYNEKGLVGGTGSESAPGYYTRYPPLATIIDGVVKKLGGGKSEMQVVFVVLSVIGLWFFWQTLKMYSPPENALFGMVFTGLTVGWLDLIDCIAPYALSEFFRFGAIYYFVKNSRLILWVFLFLESVNSFDYILYLQAFFLIYYLQNDRKDIVKKMLVLGSAPLAGLGLHFIQVQWAMSHYNISAIYEFTKLTNEKIWPVDKGVIRFCTFPFYFFKSMDAHFIKCFGFTLILPLTLIGMFPQKRQETLLFGLPTLTWWVIFPNQTASFYNTALHALPLVGFLASCLTAPAFSIALVPHLATVWNYIKHEG